MTKKYDRTDFGVRHNTTQAMAERLRRDGFISEANKYARDYNAEQHDYNHVTALTTAISDLGRFDQCGHATRTRKAMDVVDWLLDNGWTPPAYLATTDTTEKQ